MSTTDELLWARWDDVDRRLEAALDLPPAERAAFLERVAAEDAEPAQEVRQRFVEVGRRSDARIEIVEGVEAGEVIVTAGQNITASE